MIFDDTGMSKLNNKFRLGDGNYYFHYCPGCDSVHGFPVRLNDDPTPPDGTKWFFNGDLNNPTFAPSIRITSTKPSIQGNPDSPPVEFTMCHYNITNGNIVYQNDCAHPLKGMTIPVPYFPIPTSE